MIIQPQIIGGGSGDTVTPDTRFAYSRWATQPTWLAGLDMSGQTSLANCFNNCTALTELDISQWDISAVTTVANLFNNCTALMELKLPSTTTGSITTAVQAFAYCNKLGGRIDLSNWSMDALKGADALVGMFRNFGSSYDGDIEIVLPELTGTTLVASRMFASAGKSGYNFKVTINGNVDKFTTAQLMFQNSKVTEFNVVGVLDFAEYMTYNSDGFYDMWITAPNLTKITGTFANIGKKYPTTAKTYQTYCNLDHDSAMVFINGLYDLVSAGSSITHTINFSTITYGNLSAADIAVATAKGWTVTS